MKMFILNDKIEAEIPVTTRYTAVTGTVKPRVGVSHTVPVPAQPFSGTPRVFPYPCRSLLRQAQGMLILEYEGPQTDVESPEYQCQPIQYPGMPF
jgi:hypothetical protein